MGRWIGIDYGVRRIGLAVSDFGESIASPASVLTGSGNASEDARSIAAWGAAQAGDEAAGFVVGLPLNMDGSDSTQTTLTRAFADELRRRTDRPVELWDERLSSFQADELLASAGVPRSRQKTRRDAVAAQVILQSFLDARD